VDGTSFSGTYEDTKSHTTGSVVGEKVVVGKKSSSSDIVLLEMVTALLVGRLSGSLIIGKNADIFMDRVENVNVELLDNDSSMEEVENADDSSTTPGTECTVTEYKEKITSPLLAGGLPFSEVQSHMKLVLQNIRETTKGGWPDQIVG